MNFYIIFSNCMTILSLAYECYIALFETYFIVTLTQSKTWWKICESLSSGMRCSPTCFSWKIVFYSKLEELNEILFNEKATLVRPVTRNPEGYSGVYTVANILILFVPPYPSPRHD